MTTEAIAGFIARDVAAKCSYQARWWIQRVAYRPIETINCGVIADAAFVQLVIVAQDICLSDVCVSEHVRDRFVDCFFAIGHTIGTLLALGRNLVYVGTTPKG